MDLKLLLCLALVLMLLVIVGAFLTRPRRTGHLAYRVGPDQEGGLYGRRRTGAPARSRHTRE